MPSESIPPATVPRMSNNLSTLPRSAKRSWKECPGAFALAIMLGLAAFPPSAHGQTLTVLYAFKGGTDGAGPAGGLIRDAAGNFYGTTYYGGDLTCGSGCGTVFELTANGEEKILYTFTGAPDGNLPTGGVILDDAGSLFGTTELGGASGGGMVFKLDRAGKQTVLHNFTGAPDGQNPVGGVVRDTKGNLYGTTAAGGDAQCLGSCGIVFKLDPTGTETLLHTFTGGGDGEYPESGVIRDSAGDLIGTTETGGASGYGSVFKLNAAGRETVLHSFSGGPDGIGPYAGLLPFGTDLYGTTSTGGAHGHGTVFKVDFTGTETVLYAFTGGDDGSEPVAGLIHDGNGNLYGVTLYGGSFHNGTVFRLDSAGKETLLHTFTGGADGANPSGGLIRDESGNLYGTALNGGEFGAGTIFKITP